MSYCTFYQAGFYGVMDESVKQKKTVKLYR